MREAIGIVIIFLVVCYFGTIAFWAWTNQERLRKYHSFVKLTDLTTRLFFPDADKPGVDPWPFRIGYTLLFFGSAALLLYFLCTT
jgi:hypothetical protein